MKWSHIGVLFVSIINLGVAPAQAGFVANAYGSSGKYRVFEFTSAGNLVRPVTPMSALDSAWPAAVEHNGTRHVFVSELVNGTWARIRLYTSLAGGVYADAGVVFEAGSEEPHGVGPTDLTFDGTTWRLFYLIRGDAGPGRSIGLAISNDGVNFARQGVVYTAAREAPGGLSLSYACSEPGRHHLLIHAYSSDLVTASSFLATASSVSGPYTFSATTLTPSAAGGTITGLAGDSFAVFTGTIQPGRPIVVAGPTGVAPYFVTEVVGSILYLNRPLEMNYREAAFADTFARKVDLSFIRKSGAGWVGAATGYGSLHGLFAEYSGPVYAPSITGPWKHGKGHFLSPYFNEGRISTENPSPVRTNPSC